MGWRPRVGFIGGHGPDAIDAECGGDSVCSRSGKDSNSGCCCEDAGSTNGGSSEHLRND
jgi:hypothetical protein